MRTSCFCVLATALLFSRSPAAQTADDASRFVQEVTIHAPPSSVWSVLTTSEGYKTWELPRPTLTFASAASSVHITAQKASSATMRRLKTAYSPMSQNA